MSGSEQPILRLRRGTLEPQSDLNKDYQKWTWKVPRDTNNVESVLRELAALVGVQLAKKLNMLADSFMRETAWSEDFNQLPLLMHKLYKMCKSDHPMPESEGPGKVADSPPLGPREHTPTSPTVTICTSSTNRENIKVGLQSGSLVKKIIVQATAAGCGNAAPPPSPEDDIGRWLTELASMAAEAWEHEKDLQLTALGAWCSQRSESCRCLPMQRSSESDAAAAGNPRKFSFQSQPAMEGMYMVAAETSFEDLGIPGGVLACESPADLVVVKTADKKHTVALLGLIELKLSKDMGQLEEGEFAVKNMRSTPLLQTVAHGFSPFVMSQGTTIELDDRHLPALTALVVACSTAKGTVVQGTHGQCYSMMVSFQLRGLGDSLDVKCTIDPVSSGLAKLADAIRGASSSVVAASVRELTTLHGVLTCPEGCRMSCFACPLLRSPCISQGLLISMMCTQGDLDEMFRDISEGIHWKAASWSSILSWFFPASSTNFLLKVCGRPWRSVLPSFCVRDALLKLLTSNAAALQHLPVCGFVMVRSIPVIIMNELAFTQATKELLRGDPHGFAEMMSSLICSLSTLGLCHLDIRIPNFGLADHRQWVAVDPDSIAPYSLRGERAQWEHPWMHATDSRGNALGFMVIQVAAVLKELSITESKAVQAKVMASALLVWAAEAAQQSNCEFTESQDQLREMIFDGLVAALDQA